MHKHRKWVKLLLLAASLLVLTSCKGEGININNWLSDKPTNLLDSFTNEFPKNERLEVTFEKHIDGDTSYFLWNGTSYKTRYLLIDTPETVKPNTEPQPFGVEASERTKQLLAEAETIQIELDQGNSRDFYGRVQAYIFVDNTLIQEILVREGLARVAYIKEPNTKYLELLLEVQEQAKNAGLGIWSMEGEE